MTTTNRASTAPYTATCGTASLDAVAVEAKPTPLGFVDKENLYVTDATSRISPTARRRASELRQTLLIRRV